MKLSQTILVLAAACAALPSSAALRHTRGGARGLSTTSAASAIHPRVLQDEEVDKEEDQEVAPPAALPAVANVTEVAAPVEPEEKPQQEEEPEEEEVEEPEDKEEEEVEEPEDKEEEEEVEEPEDKDELEESEDKDDEEDEPVDKEDKDDEAEAKTVFVPTDERLCEYYADRNDEFDFKCSALQSSSETNVIEDKLKFKVRVAKDGVVIKVSYEHEDQTNTTETETEMAFDVRFDKLVEYKKGKFEPEEGMEEEDVEVGEVEVEEPEDGPEDGPTAVARQSDGGSSITTSTTEAFEFDLDTIIQEFHLSEWSGLSPVVESASGNLLTFNSSAFGVVEFAFTIAQSTEGAISANSMKIDVTIEDFPWMETGSYLALISHVETDYDVKVKDDDRRRPGLLVGDEPIEGEPVEGPVGGPLGGPGEAEISFQDIGALFGYEAFGRYAWAAEAEATSMSNNTDGRELQMSSTIEVIATMKEGDEEHSKQDIAFSFVGAGASGADRIYWDPEAGVGYSQEASSSSTVRWGLTGAAAIAALAAAMIL